MTRWRGTISDWRYRAAVRIFVQCAVLVGLVLKMRINVLSFGHPTAERIGGV
jgi:hypothetical protein